MLCSVSKSGPTNWLDRLRSNKALSGEPQNSMTSLELTTHSSNAEFAEQDEPMAAILSHLFAMDENAPRPKKLRRKQPNPKFYSTSSTIVFENYAERMKTALCCANSDNNSNNLRENDEQEDDVEMKGYSRSVVAVIDTSCEGWRMERLVYRKKSVWRVREKKGSVVLRKKKRKGNDFDRRNGNGNNKEKIVGGNKLKVDRKEEMSPDSSGSLCQVPKNRLKSFRSARKFKKSGSSSVLIRAFSTGKKIAPKNHVQDV